MITLITDLMPYILIVIAYLVGALPMSIIVGKIAMDVDVREHGSGNPGTTNAFRVLGRKLGFTVFFLDVFKGGFIILLIRLGLFDGFDIFHPLLYGLFAALGHIYPVFLKFKGGKAVATGAGVFLFYAPVLGITGIGAFLAMLWFTRYVSVASVTGASTLLLTTLLVFFFGPAENTTAELFFSRGGDIWMPLIGLVATGLIIYRHRTNFKRLKEGTEPKTGFGFKSKDKQ